MLTKTLQITVTGHIQPNQSLLSVHCPFTFRVQNPNNLNDLSRKKAPVLRLAAKQGLVSRGKNAEFSQGRDVPTWKPNSSLLRLELLQLRWPDHVNQVNKWVGIPYPLGLVEPLLQSPYLAFSRSRTPARTIYCSSLHAIRSVRLQASDNYAR